MTNNPVLRLDQIEYTEAGAINHAKCLAKKIDEIVYIYIVRESWGLQYEIYIDPDTSGLTRDPDIAVEPDGYVS